MKRMVKTMLPLSSPGRQRRGSQLSFDSHRHLGCDRNSSHGIVGELPLCPCPWLLCLLLVSGRKSR